jgi:hypothetical protein
MMMRWCLASRDEFLFHFVFAQSFHVFLYFVLNWKIQKNLLPSLFSYEIYIRFDVITLNWRDFSSLSVKYLIESEWENKNTRTSEFQLKVIFISFIIIHFFPQFFFYFIEWEFSVQHKSLQLLLIKTNHMKEIAFGESYANSME